MARKIKQKSSKEVKSLLIAMLIGDGTISNNYVFKLSHSEAQREYLEWKLNLLNELSVKNNGIKEYVSKCGYNTGSNVLYSQMSVIPIIKVLRRTVYTPKKKLSKRLLNWLTPQGLAIWFMDDGCMNINESKQRSSTQCNIKIATCVKEDEVEEIIEYFKERWDISMRKFKEGKGTFSISTSAEKDTLKFIDIIKPYVEQVPSLLYKIRTSGTKESFIAQQKADSETRDTLDCEI